MSTFAATTCSIEDLPADLRENWLPRGRIACTIACGSPAVGLSTTQSPTAGSAARPAARSSRPANTGG